MDILQELIIRSPKVELEEFLKTFKGTIFYGEKGFREARKHLKDEKGECVIIFHSWWVILKNGADWMNCLKIVQGITIAEQKAGQKGLPFKEI